MSSLLEESRKFFGELEKLAKKDKSSAGILLFCPEDNSIFLCQRAKEMSSPGTWDIAGGRWDKKDKDQFHTAYREATEELGNLPKTKELINTYDLETNKDHPNDYRVFNFSIPLSEKKKWKPEFDPEEVAEGKWVPINDLPEKTHFDLSWVPKMLDTAAAAFSKV